MAVSDSAAASVATIMEVSDSAIESVATKVVQGLGYEAMKHEQLQIVTGVLRGRDVFGVLPTGFGKTLCFTCLPGVYDKLYQTVEPSIVLVVSPLIAIMKDQVSIYKNTFYIVFNHRPLLGHKATCTNTQFIHKERNCLIWDRTHGFPFQAHTI